MDPITIMAAATVAFNGVKKAVELGREISDIYSQLSIWAGHVGDFHRTIAEIEMRKKKPSIFHKITFAKSETAEAFDLYAAKQKLIEWEKEIYHMFLYGELNHLGRDGYDEFRRIREEIRLRRNKMIMDQLKARKEFFETLKIIIVVGLIVLAGSLIGWLMIDYAITAAQAVGNL